jgi:uncharacterized protein (UPF0297 family)
MKKKITKSIALTAIIVIIVVCCNSDRRKAEERGTMSIEKIDKALAAEMEKDFEKLLMLIYKVMKNKGYIRDDLTYTFSGDPGMTQFSNMFAQYVLNRVKYIGQTEPSLVNGLFRDVNVSDPGYYNAEETQEIIEEIVNKKKADMITKLLNSIEK